MMAITIFITLEDHGLYASFSATFSPLHSIANEEQLQEAPPVSIYRNTDDFHYKRDGQHREAIMHYHKLIPWYCQQNGIGHKGGQS